MSAPIRLLVSDIDGTLVRPDKSLGEPVVRAAARLREAGIMLALISARPLSGMLAIARRLEIEAPVGAFNGGVITRLDGKILSAHRLDPEVATRALAGLHRPGVTPWLFADGEWYAPPEATTHDDSERITAAREPVIRADLDALTARVDKLVGVCDDGPKLAALEAELARALGDGASVARSQAYYLDVTAPEANKGAGVTRIAQALGVPLAETAVIGDGRNDMAMFAVAGFSVAMGNGSDEVRGAADATTLTNAEDGVADAIDRLIIPPSRRVRHMKKLVAFDLDGTLAESKQAIQPDMAEALRGLLEVAEIAVISGGDWPQFQKQVIRNLPKAAKLDRLWIMPTTGSKLYRFQNDAWTAIYAHDFTPEEGQEIRDALDKAVADAGLKGEKIWGEQVEDRGSQITFSGLGQDAPLEAKKGWDPDLKKRKALQATLAKALPELSINLGGATSIDVTQKGVDKAYAVRELAKQSGIALEEMLFMGDATYPGGNDAPVPEKAKVDTLTVRDPVDTVLAIRAVVACLKP